MPGLRGVRRDERKPFAGELHVVVAGRLGEAHGCNISVHGACITCRFRLGRGDALQVDLSAFGAGLRAAIVRHATRQRDQFVVGVEFFEPLSDDELVTLSRSDPSS